MLCLFGRFNVYACTYCVQMYNIVRVVYTRRVTTTGNDGSLKIKRN